MFGIIAASAKPNEWFLYQLLVPIAAAIAWSMSLAGSFLTINPANASVHPPLAFLGLSEETLYGRVQRDCYAAVVTKLSMVHCLSI